MRPTLQIGLTLLSLALAPPAAAEPARLTLLDGTTQTVSLTAISAGGALPGASELTLDDLLQIERPEAAAKPLADRAAVVELPLGRLLVSGIQIANEKCRLDWLDNQSLTIPLEGVQAIQFGPGDPLTEFATALQQPNAEHDRAFLRGEAGAISAVPGLIESLDDRQLKLENAGQTREIPLDQVAGLIIAQPAATAAPQPFTVHLIDGSRLAGAELALQAGQTSLRVPQIGPITFPWSAVVRIDIRSARVQYLSDLKPLAELHEPIVTLPLPAERDRSASGGPLRLADRTYAKGLGVHSRSSLTFAAGGHWNQFAATIGLDPERGAKGDCIFKVVADGSELYSQRLQGGSPPESIQLDITGRQQVTLLVEPGQGLDLADHANWCEARFLKNKPPR